MFAPVYDATVDILAKNIVLMSAIGLQNPMNSWMIPHEHYRHVIIIFFNVILLLWDYTVKNVNVNLVLLFPG